MRNLVGAPMPETLAQEALQVVADIRSGDLDVADSGRVVTTVSKMTRAAMHHFFVHPLELFGAGIALRKLSEIGVSSSTRAIHYGLGKIVPKLNRKQLLQLADFLDGSLYDAARDRR